MIFGDIFVRSKVVFIFDLKVEIISFYILLEQDFSTIEEQIQE